MFIVWAAVYLDWAGFHERVATPMVGLSSGMVMLDSLLPGGDYLGFTLLLAVAIYAAVRMRRGWSPFRRKSST